MSTEPKEFWISPNHRFVVESPKEIPDSVKYWVEKPIHAIEYTAYQSLEQKLAVAVEALKSIESGILYIDKKPGRTPKTRAREALALIKPDAKKVGG